MHRRPRFPQECCGRRGLLLRCAGPFGTVLLCLVGLLFLLMKEKETTGFIQVSGTSSGKHPSTMIQATGPETFQMVMAQVNTARSMNI